MNSVNLKYKKSTLRFYYENAVKTLFQSEPIPTYYFQFNWVTSHKTWKWLKFNSTVLNWCLKPLKNVKESKQRNVSIFHVYKNATNIFNKVPIHLTIKCFWLDFTVLNHCLKTLKKVKEFKQRNFSIFSLVQVYKNGTNAFNKVSIYPCKYISFIKWFWLKSTVLNWCLRTLKNVKEFKQKNVSISLWVHVYENAINVFNKVPVCPCKFTSSIRWFWLNSTVLNWCLKNEKWKM